MTVIRIICISLIVFFGTAGCSKMQFVVSFSPEAQQLREGEKEFDRGNFQKAATIFQNVYDSDVSPQIKNTALYNLACTQIITAEDSEEFLVAIRLLDDWQRAYPSVIYVENPNLIITALKERSFVIRNDKTAIEDERDKALTKVEENKAIISRQNKKISALRNELETLQHQIKELETIDHQLQEMKNPL